MPGHGRRIGLFTLTLAAVLAVPAAPPVLAATGGGTISGMVTVTSGSWPGGHVCAWAWDSNSTSTCASSANDGTYAITGLPAGRYRVEFGGDGVHVGVWYDDTTDRHEARPVDVVAGATTSGVNATLRLGGYVAGRVTDASTGAPVAGVTACASLVMKDYGTCGTSSADGSYTTSALYPGTYLVQFQDVDDSGSATVRQYFNGAETDVTATCVVVTSGVTTHGIDAALTPGGPPGNGAAGPPVARLCACDTLQPAKPPSPPAPAKAASRSLASALTITIKEGCTASPHVRSLPPKTVVMVTTPVSGRWVPLYSVRTSPTGSVRLPALTGTEPGPYALQFTDPRGKTRYIKIAVK